MRIIASTQRQAVAALLDRRPRRDPAIERRVSQIVERVRQGGDAALRRYAQRFDRLTGAFEVPRDGIEAALDLKRVMAAMCFSQSATRAKAGPSTTSSRAAP